MSHLEDSVLDPQQQAPATTVRPKIHGVVTEFEDERDLLRAVTAVRERGFGRLDAYTPFPVHGLEEALGLQRSKLGWIVLAMGVLGAASALLLQWWTGSVAYPLVIGGKPFFALEFSIPVTFELTVLFAACGAVFGMLALNGLPRLYHPVFNHPRYRGATDDRFLLAIESNGEDFDALAAVQALRAAGGRHTEIIEA